MSSQPNNTPKETLAANHKVKMTGKFFRNQEPGRGYYERALANGALIRPNISVHHPDYGVSMEQHEINKAKRLIKAKANRRKAK